MVVVELVHVDVYTLVESQDHAYALHVVSRDFVNGFGIDNPGYDRDKFYPLKQRD